MTEDEDIVGVGVIRPLYELIVALDPEKIRKSKVAALRELIIAGHIRSNQLNINEWHAFVEPEFARILERHYGFVKCRGEAMILRLR